MRIHQILVALFVVLAANHALAGTTVELRPPVTVIIGDIVTVHTDGKITLSLPQGATIEVNESARTVTIPEGGVVIVTIGSSGDPPNPPLPPPPPDSSKFGLRGLAQTWKRNRPASVNGMYRLYSGLVDRGDTLTIDEMVRRQTIRPDTVSVESWNDWRLVIPKRLTHLQRIGRLGRSKSDWVEAFNEIAQALNNESRAN